MDITHMTLNGKGGANVHGDAGAANAHFTPVTICILKQQPNNQMNITQLQTMILRFVLEVSMNLLLHVST